MNIGVRIPAKYRNYVFSIRNLEAAANPIPIISNTVIEPHNSFVSINTKSKAEAIIIIIPTTNIILFILYLLSYLRIERLLRGVHQMPLRP